MNILVCLSLVVFLVAAVTRPQLARCPSTYHADGIRRSGVYECARPYGCRDVRSRTGGWSSTCDGEQRFGGAIYCTGGALPVLDRDGVTVGCQRGGWSP